MTRQQTEAGVLGGYDEQWADIYDDLHVHLDPSAEVDALSSLVEEGASVLELGIGTGRIALPLAARGLRVHGVDSSEAMVRRLQEKPGAESIPVTVGDFADMAVDGSFSLIFIAFNTLFALLTQEEQLRCFRNVAGRLMPGGVFAIEAFVPELSRFREGQQSFRTELITDGRVIASASRHDPVNQRISTRLIVFQDDGRSLAFPIEMRYAYPSELDLMARSAGMRLRERWGGWSREPFTAASGGHISIYELAN